MKVKVAVTDKNAVYINDYRITNRSTKWGVHKTVDEFECEEDKVVFNLIANGHKSILKKIDVEPYLSQLQSMTLKPDGEGEKRLV